VLTRMLGSRATAGEALNRIDSIGTRLDSASLNGQTERSKAEDLDMATAISDFQSKQTGYSAALKTYASVQRMSLFDYIKT
jgi:flagellar hook-associated protein 3 FlgL